MGKNQVVQHPLDRRANPNAREWICIWIGYETRHYTPLHYPANTANNRAAKLLLVAKANMSAEAGSMQMSPRSEMQHMRALGTRLDSGKTHNTITTRDEWKTGLQDGRNPYPPHGWSNTHPPQLPLDANFPKL